MQQAKSTCPTAEAPSVPAWLPCLGTEWREPVGDRSFRGSDTRRLTIALFAPYTGAKAFSRNDAVMAGKVREPISRQAPRLFVSIILAASTLLGGCGEDTTSVPAPAHLVSITIPAASGEVDSKWLSYPGPPQANVLLPAAYNPQERYPLVVFLNGLGGDYNSYAEYGLTKPFEDLGAIVVMPEGGSGWYTDWWNDGERGGPSWESYELEAVIPTILARYPILPERRYHALVGISMGGLGAAYLGGELPGFFGSVASLSGFVDPQFLGPVIQPAMALESHASTKGDDDPDPVYG